MSSALTGTFIYVFKLYLQLAATFGHVIGQTLLKVDLSDVWLKKISFIDDFFQSAMSSLLAFWTL